LNCTSPQFIVYIHTGPNFFLCVCISYIYIYVNIHICIHIYICTYTKKHLFLTVPIYLPLYTLNYYTHLCPSRHVCFNSISLMKNMYAHIGEIKKKILHIKHVGVFIFFSRMQHVFVSTQSLSCEMHVCQLKIFHMKREGVLI